VTGNDNVRRYADAIMTMIKEDQDSGQVPADVLSWDELDASVDTDDYYRQARMPSGSRGATSLRNAVTDEVNRRLASAQGGPWGVTWTRPDGQMHDIGRTTGYSTMIEAEAVGERYRTEHGGSYRVHCG
jgi:hypothetical protein